MAVRVLCAIGIVSVILLVNQCSATQFTIGGANGWSVPQNADSYNHWAEHYRFQIGDTLLFVYNQSKDSVLEVSKQDYENCNTQAPIAKYSDGHTVYTFNHSGPHYFISGNNDNCAKGQKFVLVVLADRSGKNSSNTDQTPPASPPSPTAAVPTPSPSPSPPADTNPPSQSTTKKNAASSSVVMSLFGCVGALFASSVVMVL